MSNVTNPGLVCVTPQLAQRVRMLMAGLYGVLDRADKASEAWSDVALQAASGITQGVSA